MFFKDYKVMELIRRHGFRKSKALPSKSIISYILSNVVRDRSMYSNRSLASILMAAKIVNGHLKGLNPGQRADCFVF
ncbi:hypothetical protein EFR42_04925 [Lactobacillus delbrueckii]|nr:hypothetical protein [Lactobacillus delbrueckii]MCT3491943.1 hypothetical protein [Lactobacillus delbrueckii]